MLLLRFDEPAFTVLLCLLFVDVEVLEPPVRKLLLPLDEPDTLTPLARVCEPSYLTDVLLPPRTLEELKPCDVEP